MKRNTLIMAFISLIFLFALPVNSQNRFDYVVFGIRVAGGGSLMNGWDNYTNRFPGTNIIIDQPYTTSPYFAWDIGVSMQTMYNSKVLIQSDLTFGYQATSLKDGSLEGILSFEGIGSYYTTLSVYAGSKILLGERTRFVFGIGPYVATSDWFSGKDKKYGKNVLPSEIDYYTDATLLIKEADFRSIDAGATAMVGIEFSNVQLSLNYYHGLANIVKDEHRLYNRSLKLAVTSFF